MRKDLDENRFEELRRKVEILKGVVKGRNVTKLLVEGISRKMEYSKRDLGGDESVFNTEKMSKER